MKIEIKFILIDDDPFNNTICQFIINESYPDASIKSFESPENALTYIEETYSNKTIGEGVKVVLLVDINMPTLSGWEVMELFNNFSFQIRSQFKTFILTSSIDKRDKERAMRTEGVIALLEKPLVMDQIISKLDL